MSAPVETTSPVLLSKEHLATLKVGDTFASEGVFQGVTVDGTIWEATTVNHATGEYVFRVTYLRVLLGEFSACINKKGQVEVEAF